MAGFTLSTQITATPDVVFDFMTNPDNAAKIMHNVTKMETLSWWQCLKRRMAATWNS
jgi:hypothetical protein